jgi:hypothetical protein
MSMGSSSPSILSNSQLINGINKSSNPNDNQTNNNLAIEPGEDDAIDDGLTVRHHSHTRYLRNHRLISEIFNEFTVPDSRAIVTQARLESLEKQSQSLEKFYQKVNNELMTIDEKYETKKRKFQATSKEFQDELDKVCGFFFR